MVELLFGEMLQQFNTSGAVLRLSSNEQCQHTVLSHTHTHTHVTIQLIVVAASEQVAAVLTANDRIAAVFVT